MPSIKQKDKIGIAFPAICTAAETYFHAAQNLLSQVVKKLREYFLGIFRLLNINICRHFKGHDKENSKIVTFNEHRCFVRGKVRNMQAHAAICCRGAISLQN